MSTAAPELTQQWWGVDLGGDLRIVGPYRTREGAEHARDLDHAKYGTTGRIVTCRATAWEDA